MQTAFGTCEHCGGHHDRLSVTETEPGVYTGACPTNGAVITLHVGVAAIPEAPPPPAATAARVPRPWFRVADPEPVPAAVPPAAADPEPE